MSRFLHQTKVYPDLYNSQLYIKHLCYNKIMKLVPRKFIIPFGVFLSAIICVGVISSVFFAKNSYAEPNTSNNQSAAAAQDKDKMLEECNKSAGWLGWMICPTVVNSSESIFRKLYEFLYLGIAKIDSGLMKMDDNNPTFVAWKQIRDIANVFFIIAFLAVIISQLTGLGIDNYGIKKTLPKLIVAVILINLSFILSQLFVDLSNMIGTAIIGFFENIPVGGSVSPGGGVSAVIAAVLVAVIASAVINPGLIISFALLLIPMVGALLLSVALLMVRQVAVIALVILSPVAVAMLILPNTKSLIDRFKKLAVAMWVFYPICGFIIGVSGFMAKIMLSMSTNLEETPKFLYSVAGLGIMTLPFFILPRVLQKMADNFGNIGTIASRAARNISSNAYDRANRSSLVTAAKGKLLGLGGDNKFINAARSGKYSPFRRSIANTYRAQEQATKDRRADDLMLSQDARAAREEIAKIEFEQSTNRDLLQDSVSSAKMDYETRRSTAAARLAIGASGGDSYYDMVQRSRQNSAQNKITSELVQARSDQIESGTFQGAGSWYDETSHSAISGNTNITDSNNEEQLTRALQAAISNRNTVDAKAIMKAMSSRGMGKGIQKAIDGASRVNAGFTNSSHADYTSFAGIRNAMAEGMSDAPKLKSDNPEIAKWAKNVLKGSTNTDLSTNTISAMKDLTADAATSIDLSSMEYMQDTLAKAISAATDASGALDVSKLQPDVRNAIRNYNNISQAFNRNDVNGKRLKGKTKQEVQDAMDIFRGRKLATDASGRDLDLSRIAGMV